MIFLVTEELISEQEVRNSRIPCAQGWQIAPRQFENTVHQAAAQFQLGLEKAVTLSLTGIRVPSWSEWRECGIDSENFAGAIRRAIEVAFLRCELETQKLLRDMVIEVCTGRPQRYGHFKSRWGGQVLVFKHPDAEDPLTINNTGVRMSVEVEPGDQRTFMRMARDDRAAKMKNLTANRWLSNHREFDENRPQLRDTARHDLPEPPRPIQEQRIQDFLTRRWVSDRASCALWLAWHHDDWREIESILNESLVRDWSGLFSRGQGRFLLSTGGIRTTPWQG